MILLAAIVVAQFDGFPVEARFSGNDFKAPVEFRGEHAHGTWLSGVRFRDRVLFQGTQLRGETYLTGVHFESVAQFRDVAVHGPAWFIQPTGGMLQFAGKSVFHHEAVFQDFQLANTSIGGVTFKGPTIFAGKPLRDFYIEGCTFELGPDLGAAGFAGTLSFANSRFKEGLDLRFTDLTQTKRVILDGIDVDPRQLRLSWLRCAESSTSIAALIRETGSPTSKPPTTSSPRPSKPTTARTTPSAPCTSWPSAASKSSAASGTVSTESSSATASPRGGWSSWSFR